RDHRQRSRLQHVERRRRRQAQGHVGRRRVLLALAPQLHRRQYERHREHQRPWLSAADLGDADPENPAGVFRRLTSLRAVRRPVGSARRRELVRDEGTWTPSQPGVDVRRQVARGLHGLSLPRRCEGSRVPHQLRDEFLSGGDMTRFTGAVLVALIAVTPQAPRDAPNEFYDSHFHLTNYVQEGITAKQFLQTLGARVRRSTLFGIPLQQQWSYGNSGDFAPTYYLHSDAPLYYYSFTDAWIASQYRSLAR